jgi:two-component system, chemotaxis family, CheB/CheR fusion protein
VPATEQDDSREARAELAAELSRLRHEHERVLSENENLTEALRMLEESRDAYLSLYHEAPIGWVMLDANGTITALNEEAIVLLGFEPVQLLGTPLKSLVVPEDRRAVFEHLAECAGGRRPKPCEVRLQCRGRPLHVRLESRPSREPRGNHATAIVDLSEHDRADAERAELLRGELRARAANEAKDQFIAMLSHELRTPLTPVLAAVSALVERDDLPSDLGATMAMLLRNVSAEARLIDDLLDVTRIMRGKLSLERHPLDLHRLLLESIETLRGHADARVLEVELAAARHWVFGDDLRLRQVLLNLLKNALQFTPPGGRIKVGSWNREQRIVIEVSDDGRGITPRALTRLFEPFEQVPDEERASNGGLGLGLAISRGIVELHGGVISATSRGLGLGARFLVELEVVAPVVERRPASRHPLASRSEKPARILLVEDHADTAETFSELLRMSGHEVRVATSMAAALAVELGEDDVVVSDIGLPDGSGLELVQRLRERQPVRAIALSGYGTEADKAAARAAGFSAHLTKPVAIEQILRAIAGL